MPKRSRKKEDVNQTAHRVGAEATGRIEKQSVPKLKNPAAVALGRLGGAKGGKARAAKLGAEQRSKIASDAATARWAKRLPEGP